MKRKATEDFTSLFGELKLIDIKSTEPTEYYAKKFNIKSEELHYIIIKDGSYSMELSDYSTAFSLEFIPKDIKHGVVCVSVEEKYVKHYSGVGKYRENSYSWIIRGREKSFGGKSFSLSSEFDRNVSGRTPLHKEKYKDKIFNVAFSGHHEDIAPTFFFKFDKDKRQFMVSDLEKFDSIAGFNVFNLSCEYKIKLYFLNSKAGTEIILSSKVPKKVIKKFDTSLDGHDVTDSSESSSGEEESIEPSDEGEELVDFGFTVCDNLIIVCEKCCARKGTKGCYDCAKRNLYTCQTCGKVVTPIIKQDPLSAQKRWCKDCPKGDS